ncbi:helix-turn-helix domain-containing protein [Chryseobacterium sp.]|uniref:helix-turn-helix domain-containing protein n=1 Tax=Chryseobacterium sp. TaxID=1871047 RepID=UPI0025BD2AD3|nr:helix-turn-helix domain-containing protein [Chryseobacterium sp.]
MQRKKLRSVRKRKGFTQQQVADFIATDVSNYSRKESGYQNQDICHLVIDSIGLKPIAILVQGNGIKSVPIDVLN